MTPAPIMWTSNEAVQATGGVSSGEWQASGVSINTRTMEVGDLFFALSGPRFDGHDFANDALRHGAAAVVVSRVIDSETDNANCLTVDDTLAALEAMACTSRDRMNGKVIAVTGSVGKTSTKEMLRLVLSGQGAVSASYGNLNNHWGLPLSLSRMLAASDFGLFELGMSNPGEIRPLSKMTRPHVAIITAIEPVHAEFFKSVDEIADAKAEIFDGVVDNGYAVINQDSLHFDRLRAAAVKSGVTDVRGFGHHERAWARIECTELLADNSDVAVIIDGTRYRYRIGAPGEHLVMNSAAVLAAVSLVGGDVKTAAERFVDYRPLRGRGNNNIVETPTGEIVVINESYNASPVSMRAALEVLGRIHPSGDGRRIAVIGDMLELGARAHDEHMSLLDVLRSNKVDLVFTSGQYTQALWDVLPGHMRGGHSVSPDKLSLIVTSAVNAGDVIMVKGSLGSKVGIVVDSLLALDDTLNLTGEN